MTATGQVDPGPGVRTDARHEEPVDGRPRWQGVDDTSADLLAHLAGPGYDSEWAAFLGAVRALAAEHAGRINPNLLRPILRRDEVHPRRVGAFYRRALLSGLLTDSPELWATSTDLKSKNRGKPCRVYTYVPESDPTR